MKHFTFLVDGRVSRQQFRRGFLLHTLGFAVALFFSFARLAGAPNILAITGVILTLFYLFAITRLAIQRFHDLNEPGWMLVPAYSGEMQEWKTWKRLFMEEGLHITNDYGSATSVSTSTMEPVFEVKSKRSK